MHPAWILGGGLIAGALGAATANLLTFAPADFATTPVRPVVERVTLKPASDGTAAYLRGGKLPDYVVGTDTLRRDAEVWTELSRASATAVEAQPEGRPGSDDQPPLGPAF